MITNAPISISLGKSASNYLVYKNNRNDHFMSVYASEMKLISRNDLNPENERWINVDFIPYPHHVWMIYQYQQKSIVYCMAVKLDSAGNRWQNHLNLILPG
jgi:hypothetical protein